MTTENPNPSTPPAATPPASTPPPAQNTWTDGLADDLKGYVQTKGFKDPKDVLESYRNFEKLQGLPKERLLQLPETLEGDVMNPVWERLGAPKEAKEYKLELPKEIGDEKVVEELQGLFHKLKVPRNMAETFVKEWTQKQMDQLKATKEGRALQLKQEFETLKKEWGAAHEQNEKIAEMAAQKFGMSKDDVAALGASMGPIKAMKFLYKLGEGLGEATFVAGNGQSPGILTPEQARFQIKQLISDTDFQRRIQNKEADALNKWTRLHQFAYPGEMRV